MKYSSQTVDGYVELGYEYFYDDGCQDYGYSYFYSYSAVCSGSYGNTIASVTTQMDPTSIAIYSFNNIGQYPYSVECENSGDWASVTFYQEGCFFVNGIGQFVSFQCDGPSVDISFYSTTSCEISSLTYYYSFASADSNSCPIVNTTSYNDQYSILQCSTPSPSFAPSGPSPAPTLNNQKYFQVSYYYDCTAQSTPYAYDIWALEKCITSSFGDNYMYLRGINPDGSLSIYMFLWYYSSDCSGSASFISSIEEGIPPSCDSSAPFWIASTTTQISGSVGYKYFEDLLECDTDDWGYLYLLGEGCIRVDSSSSYRVSCDTNGYVQEIDYYGSNSCSAGGVSSTFSTTGFLSINDCSNTSSTSGISQFYCPQPSTIIPVRSPTLAPSTPTVIESGFYLYSEYQPYSQCNMPGYMHYFSLGVCFSYGDYYSYKNFGLVDPLTNTVGIRQEYFSDNSCTSLYEIDESTPFARQDCTLAFLSTAKIVDSLLPGYIGNLSFTTQENCDLMNSDSATYSNSGCSRSSISTCQGDEISTLYYSQFDIACAGQPINYAVVSFGNISCQLNSYYYYTDDDFPFAYHPWVTTTCIPQPSASPTLLPSLAPPTSSSSSTSSSLSAGGIAGIVIAIIVLFVVCGVVIYFRLKPQASSDTTQQEPKTIQIFSSSNPMVDSNL